MDQKDKDIIASAGIMPGRAIQSKRMPYRGPARNYLMQSISAEKQIADMEAEFRRLFPDAILER